MEINGTLPDFQNYHGMAVAGHVPVRNGQNAEFWQFHLLYFLSQFSYLKRGLSD